MAHYADQAFDIEYQFPIGWQEVEGIHSRTDFDLKQHEIYCKKNLHYVDQEQGNAKYLPYVLETSVGLDRHLLSLLCDAYRMELVAEGEERTVLKLSPAMAPIKVAVMPLQKKPQLVEMARKLMADIQRRYKAEYDVAGSIGKRYRRQDEIGTPLCLTVDFDSLQDHGVTLRDRDSMQQERVNREQVLRYLEQKLP